MHAGTLRGASAMAVTLVGTLLTQRGGAAPTYKWAELASVRSVAVVAPVLATRPSIPKNADDDDVKPRYLDVLRGLLDIGRRRMPIAIAQAGRFTVVTEKATQAALRSEHWTAADLFAEHGITSGKRWPAPVLPRLTALCRRLKVDAVLVMAMREPASISPGVHLQHETWNPNPLNLSVKARRAHVVSPHIQATLVTSRGIIAWQDDALTNYPRTKPETAHTLELDWDDATRATIQELADSLLRLPPP